MAAYALSPIDLIPDFVPALGYLDGLLIVPLGIMLVVRLVPDALMAEFRAMAVVRKGRPVIWAGLVMIVALWALAVAASLWLFWLIHSGRGAWARQPGAALIAARTARCSSCRGAGGPRLTVMPKANR